MQEEATSAVNNVNVLVFYAAIVLGILALVVGYLYNANLYIGYHPSRAVAAWAVGGVLIIIGFVGIVMARRRAEES
jgi:hypothetical protein